jgi:hypothetical protein
MSVDIGGQATLLKFLPSHEIRPTLFADLDGINLLVGCFVSLKDPASPHELADAVRRPRRFILEQVAHQGSIGQTTCMAVVDSNPMHHQTNSDNMLYQKCFPKYSA